MEHRYADRKEFRLGVVISLPRLGLITGYTSDISLGGMFIETDCVAAPVNALVTVSFQLDDDPMVCFQAKAMIVHQRAGGFGLMFDRLEPDCTRALRNMIAAPVMAGGQAEAIGSNEDTKPAEAYPRWATG